MILKPLVTIWPAETWCKRAKMEARVYNKVAAMSSGFLESENNACAPALQLL